MALPDCDTLFLQYFAPSLTEDDRNRRIYPTTRPDVERIADGYRASDMSPLESESQMMVAEQVREMLEAAEQDWKKVPLVEFSPSLNWLRGFERHFQYPDIEKVIGASKPEDAGNDYFVLCCELGAVTGAVLRTCEPRLRWLYDWPYWESALYDTRTGARLNVFHWAMKKLSASAWNDSLVAKVENCLTLLNGEPDEED